MTAYSTSTWRVVRAVAAEGARVGFMPCLICGAAILVDPDDDTNRVEQHRAWHALPPIDGSRP